MEATKTLYNISLWRKTKYNLQLVACMLNRSPFVIVGFRYKKEAYGVNGVSALDIILVNINFTFIHYSPVKQNSNG